MMERDCDECDWVEVTCLSSATPDYVRGMPCAEHRHSIGALRTTPVDLSALADTFSTANPGGVIMPIQPAWVYTGSNGIMRDAAGNPVEWDPGYLGYGAMLWRSGWPMLYGYRPLWLNLSLCVGWIVMALLLVVPALLAAGVVRMALPTRRAL